MNYFLFIMMMKEMISMEAKGQPGATPAVYPLLSLQSSDWYCVFSDSPLPPHEIAKGIYIVGFRSR
jgi:hypothetical protein